MNRKLEKAFRDVGGVFTYQAIMAYCLLSVNGEQNAVDFVYGLRERRLTPHQPDAARPGEAEQLGFDAAQLKPVR